MLGCSTEDFAASPVRSTWLPPAPGVEAVGQERRPAVAVLRRVRGSLPVVGDVWVPFVFHFDSVDTVTGATVMVSERQRQRRTDTR